LQATCGKQPAMKQQVLWHEAETATETTECRRLWLHRTSRAELTQRSVQCRVNVWTLILVVIQKVLTVHRFLGHRETFLLSTTTDF